MHHLRMVLIGFTTNCYGQTVTKTFCYEKSIVTKTFCNDLTIVTKTFCYNLGLLLHQCVTECNRMFNIL